MNINSPVSQSPETSIFRKEPIQNFSQSLFFVNNNFNQWNIVNPENNGNTLHEINHENQKGNSEHQKKEKELLLNKKSQIQAKVNDKIKKSQVISKEFETMKIFPTSCQLEREQKLKEKIIITKSSKKGSRIKEDIEYIPQKENKKEVSHRYKQNEKRNIIPNQVNQVFSFIQKRNKSGYLVEKLFARYPHEEWFSLKRFYLYQSLLNSKIGHYNNPNSLILVTQLYEPKCEIWPESEQRYYSKICRVLIRHFLLEDSIFITLTSKRMKSQRKIDHIKARRLIAEQVLRVLRGL